MEFIEAASQINLIITAFTSLIMVRILCTK